MLSCVRWLMDRKNKKPVVLIQYTIVVLLDIMCATCSYIMCGTSEWGISRGSHKNFSVETNVSI